MLGIIGAMQVEINALRQLMTDQDVRVISGMEYVKGKLDGHDVVAVVCGEGKVASGICAQTLILQYGVDKVINTGVAGTLCDELGIKDVAVARDVVQHDMDVTALGLPLGQIPSLNLSKIPCDQDLVAALEQAVQEQGCNYRVGTIASGDMFLHTVERKQFIVEHFGAIAGEMEGASIGQVCYLNSIPFVVLRTMSDDASGHAPASFERFAAEAAELACAIVRRFVTLAEGEANQIEKIQSFTVDHDKLEPGLYISRVDGTVTTYDLRTRKPNAGDYMDNLTMHSVEHLFATYVRSSPIGLKVLYFGPMGCQTGFYLLVDDTPKEQVLEAIELVLRQIVAHTGPVFGAARRECGNYRNLNLEAAQLECSRYLQVLENSKPISFQYR